MIQLLHIVAQTESAGGISALGIDPWAILAQAVTFLVLFIIIKQFALGKIVAMLQKRQKIINDGIDLGLKMAEEQKQLEERVEKKLAEARVEADKLIAAGQQAANELLREAEAKAAAKFDAMLADAQLRIEEDVERARKELEKELLELIGHATEVILAEKLNPTKDAQLIKKALEEVRT